MLLTKGLTSPHLDFGIIGDLNILRVQKHKFFLLKNSINNSEHKPTNKRIIPIHQQHNLIIRTIIHNPMIDWVHGAVVVFVFDDFDFVCGNLLLLDVVEHLLGGVVWGVVVHVDDVVVGVVLHEDRVQVAVE